MALFEGYYLQTLAAQTKPDFTVLLLIDDQTPHEAIAAMQAVLPDDRFVFTKAPKGYLTEPCITTRIDTDDAISVDFVEEVQKHAKEGYLVNFLDGYVEDEGRFYPFSQVSNMFLSLCHASKTCYCHKHTLMQFHFPSVNLVGERFWIHTQHENAVTDQRGLNKKFTIEPEPLDRTRFPVARSVPPAQRDRVDPQRGSTVTAGDVR